MIKKYNSEYITLFLTIIMMVLIPLQKLFIYTLNYLKITRDLYEIHLAYIIWFIGCLLLINYILSLLLKKIKIDNIDILFYILSLITIVSTYFTIHQHKAIYGEINRFEGLFTLLSYYITFLNIKNIKREDIKKVLVYIFIAIGILQISYAILQVFTDLEFIRKFNKPYMAHGLSGNPNFFGSLTVMLIAITSSLYLLDKKVKYLLLSAFFMIGLTLSNSTGPLLGIVIAILYLIIIKFKKIRKKELLTLLIILSLTFFTSSRLNEFKQQKKKIWIDPNYNIKEDIKSIIKKEKNIETIGSGRINLWVKSLPALKKHWLIGSGPDTFALVYTQSPGLIYDKAHNIYLQMAITTGIFSVIIYLVICYMTVVKAMNIKNNLLIALNIAFIAYSIQGFANISVIEVAPFFFIIWGLNYSYYTNVKLT